MRHNAFRNPKGGREKRSGGSDTREEPGYSLLMRVVGEKSSKTQKLDACFSRWQSSIRGPGRGGVIWHLSRKVQRRKTHRNIRKKEERKDTQSLALSPVPKLVRAITPLSIQKRGIQTVDGDVEPRTVHRARSRGVKAQPQLSTKQYYEKKRKQRPRQFH